VRRQIVWAPRASKDLFQQLDHISIESVQNAQLVSERVFDRLTLLASMPTGRAGRVFGTYEIHVPKTSLIISYELPDTKTLHVLRLIHGARDWPYGEWPED
jgi:toxin ParE1/3/4